MLNKIIVCFLIINIINPVYAEPTLDNANYIYIAPGEEFPRDFLDPNSGLWCYNDEANAILITAGDIARARCELEAELKITKEKAKFNLKIELLKAHLVAQEKSHLGVLSALKLENENLSKIALDRPSDKRLWFAAGGFAIGIATTLLIGWFTISVQGDF